MPHDLGFRVSSLLSALSEHRHPPGVAQLTPWSDHPADRHRLSGVVQFPVWSALEHIAATLLV